MTTHQHYDTSSPESAIAYFHDHPVHGGNHKHGRLERIGLESTTQPIATREEIHWEAIQALEDRVQALEAFVEGVKVLAWGE